MKAKQVEENLKAAESRSVAEMNFKMHLIHPE